MLNAVARSVVCLVLVMALGVSFSALADADWPQYGGPDRNNISQEKGLARTWPEGGPKVLWRAPVSPGYAGPAISDGKVYIMDREGQKDVLRCLDLETGKALWKCENELAGEQVGGPYAGTKTTVAISDGLAYGVSDVGELYCIDLKTHAIVWHRNLVADFEVRGLSWGMSQSPLVYKDLLLVSPQGAVSVVAMDKKTGKTVWTAESLGGVHYTMPVVTKLCGVEQVVMIGSMDKQSKAPGKIGGISLKDGKSLWTIQSTWQCSGPIPYAVTVPGDRLFISAGYRAGSVMLQVKKEGDGFVATESFKSDFCGSQLHQPLVYKDHIYANGNSNERTEGLMCMTFDGTVKWRTKANKELPDFERGGLILADDMIIDLDGKTGELYLVEPSPDGFKALAHAKVVDSKFIWAPMALSNGRLLVRGQDEMKCLDLRK